MTYPTRQRARLQRQFRYGFRGRQTVRQSRLAATICPQIENCKLAGLLYMICANFVGYREQSPIAIMSMSGQGSYKLRSLICFTRTAA
jgi:hypothetical protein